MVGRAARGDAISLLALFKQYRPIVNKLRRQYFIKDFDVDDWNQEAMIVLYKTCQKFNQGRTVSFGSFYQMSMRNRVFDLIRRSQAQKRQPTAEVVSFSAREDEYRETIRSTELIADDIILMRELLVNFRSGCSEFEALILDLLIEGYTPHQIATLFNMELTQVSNAVDRCKRKLIKRIKAIKMDTFNASADN